MHPDLEKLATLIEEAEQHNDYERACVEHLARDNAPAEMVERSDAIREVRMRIQELAKSKAHDNEADQAPTDEAEDQERVVYDPVAREFIDMLKSDEESTDALVPIGDDEIDALQKTVELVQGFPSRFRGYFLGRLVDDKVIHALTISKSISDMDLLVYDGSMKIDQLIVHLGNNPDISDELSLERILKARAVKILMDHGMYAFEENDLGMRISPSSFSCESTPGVDLTPLLREVFHELIKQGRYDDAFLVYRSYEHDYQQLDEDEITNKSIATMSAKAREGLTLAFFRYYEVGEDGDDFVALHPLLEWERSSSKTLKDDEEPERKRREIVGKDYVPYTSSVHWSKQIRGWIRGSLDVAPTTS